MKANTQTIESLAPRVKTLSELLCETFPEGDIKEGSRRKELEGWVHPLREGRVSHTDIDRKLQDICNTLTKMKEEQRKVEGFFNNTKNGETLGGLVEDIRDAMMEYQVRIHDLFITFISDIRTRLRYSKTSTTRVVDSS